MLSAFLLNVGKYPKSSSLIGIDIKKTTEKINETKRFIFWKDKQNRQTLCYTWERGFKEVRLGRKRRHHSWYHTNTEDYERLL